MLDLKAIFEIPERPLGQPVPAPAHNKPANVAATEPTVMADGGGLTIDAPQDTLTPDLLDRPRVNKANLLAMLRPPTEATLGPPLALSDTPAKPAKAVCRCGSTTWRDVVLQHAPHHGKTIRRDCGSCGRFLDFPIWYGKSTGHNGQ